MTAASISALKRAPSKSTTNDVYFTVRSWLVDGRIAPGEKINIDRLARTLGVSATPVREAVGRLEGDNLVVVTPGRGATATPLLTFHQFRQLYEFRLLVEPWAARAVSVDRLANPSVALRAELDRFEAEMVDGTVSRELTIAHDASFHELIVDATGNGVVLHAYKQTHYHLHIYRLDYTGNNAVHTVEEHRAIMESIAGCDPEAAAAAAAEHLRKSFARSAEQFSRGRDENLDLVADPSSSSVISLRDSPLS